MPDRVENRMGSAPEGQPATLTEVEALRQRVAALEAFLSDRPRQALGWTRRAKMRALLGLCAALTVTFLYGQSAVDALFVSPAGNVGIGSNDPRQKLDVAGTIRSSTGGFQFPDGTTQTTSAVSLPPRAVVAFNSQTCPAGWTEFTPAYGRFIRGFDKSGAIDPQRTLGSTQEDAMRNITGSITGVEGAHYKSWPWGFKPGTNGAFSVVKTENTYTGLGTQYDPPGGSGRTVVFDASKAPGVLIANENRPKNVALLYCESR